MSAVTAMLQTDWTRFTRDRFLFIMSIVLLVIYGVIAQVLPLADAGSAHALLEDTPVIGKIVLDVAR